MQRDAGYSTEDMLRQWPAYVMRRDIPHFLAHYELFKLVIDLPGCVVDLGVYRGASFFTFSTLMASFCAFDRSRKVKLQDQQLQQQLERMRTNFEARLDRLEKGGAGSGRR